VIDHLPRNSFYIEALLDDDEVGEKLLEMPDQPPRERLAEWSAERETLTQILDAIHALSVNVIAAAGAKPPQMRPALRPVTSLNRVRQRRQMAQHQSLVRRLTPDS
jgi:hypothetical protein